MKKIYSLLVAGTIAANSFAQQNYVHQVIILNEGQYDYTNQVQITPVTMGTYNPLLKIYTVFDTIQGAKFGSDVIVDNNNIYVAADDKLVVYDKTTLQKTNTKQISGIRKLNTWNSQLLVSRGDMVSLNSYFQVYDKNTLSLIYELTPSGGPQYSSEGIAVINDTAYLAINNSFDWMNPVGSLGIIDLNNKLYKGEVDFGADAINPDNIMVDGDMIYTLNNKDFTGSSITAYDVQTRTHNTYNVAINAGCGTSVFAQKHVYYQEYGVDKLARFDVLYNTVTDTLQNTFAFYGLADDYINGKLYATATDYFSYGKAYILEYNGTTVDSFDVGISPGSIALDIRTLTSIDENSNNPIISLYPNPAKETITISASSVISGYAITDISGREIKNEQINSKGNFTINISEIPSGIYFLSVSNEQTKMTGRFIKQ